uniref:Uncharacterized protein n=1 Tax=Kalanchoe fedtschenkoi TaxID=63787 RepID=A0A7N0VJR6_KALFE
MNFFGGCLCICSEEELRRASTSRQLSVACLVFSWIIVGAGLGALAIGTMSNNKSRTSCGFTHHHFLSIGGVLCIVHALFSVSYYVTNTATLDEQEKA